MSESVRMRLIHALLSSLMAFGLLIPLLGILDSSLITPVLIFPVVGIILVFELISASRTAVFVTIGVSFILVLIWILAMGGLLIVSDVALAVVLRFNGIRTAIPLVASSVSVLLTLLITLISCLVCLRNASVLPAVLLCFGMILLIYLTGSEEVVPWFLPALVSLLLILMTSRFPETPLVPLIPFAAFLVAAAFLVSGSGAGHNPLREKADELRQAVLDRLFFTEPRDVFSLSAEEYYPQGPDQLGGKPNPSDRPVMQVSTPRAVYLRGVALNEYTGRNWQNTTDRRRYLRQSSRLAAIRETLFDENLPPLSVRNALCEPVTVSVRMLSSSASTLFVPQRVRELIPGGDLVPYFSTSSELFVTRNLREGDTYSVSAPLFLAGDPGLGTLIEVCSTLDDSAYEQIAETYTVLPDHLEEPVYALARETASVAVSPYERALALQSWLSRSFRYTLDVDPQPPDVDFVTRFLLDTREGYCTYFASAMTVLCRMVGLPARYIEGYLAEPDQDGNALVTGLSAHAWTEVYFKGFGWLTFDASPRRSSNLSGSTDPSSSPDPTPVPPEPDRQTDTQTPEPSPESSPEPSSNPAADPGPSDPPVQPENHRFPVSSLWLLLLLLLLAAVLRIWMTSPSFRARRARSDAEKFDIWIQEITDLLYAEHLIRQSGETPMAFGRRIDRTARFGVAMGPVGECVSLIRYSRAEAAETDIGLLRDTSILLKGELSRPARARYLFRRIFVPVSKRTSL